MKDSISGLDTSQTNTSAERDSRGSPAGTPDDDKTQIRRLGASIVAPALAGSLPVVEPSVDSSLGTGTPRQPTGSSGWTDPSGWAQAPGPPLVRGSVINNRFILEECIGRGGMGTVFRARDIRKEEAQDRNPYVAIKVLNEDFRRHPDSLRALQRESRKAQKLAHPNIVTVYDFDRDGANVYMVMELLEGEPLDRLIKRSEGLGLGVRETVGILRDICHAMDYAHRQGIVHADFKPANAFLTRSGVVKIFDFGIARAVRHEDHAADASGKTDETLFDPGTLGALTPAYAGCEVVEGLEPEPRDDLYAVACVAYELITGKHPFNRLSALQAEKAGIQPAQPPGLSARQWRTLRRCLALRRADRPKSAVELLDGIRPLRRSPAVYVAAGVIAIVVLAFSGSLVSRALELLHTRNVIASLASADGHRIEPLLGELRSLDPARRGTLLLNENARAGLIKYFETRINSLVDSTRGRYDYRGAEQLLRDLEGFVPDSQAVGDVRDRFTERKSGEIRRQSDAFDLDLQRGWLIPAQNRDNIGSVLAIVRQIDPNSPLLHDPRLPGAFAESSRKALSQDQPQLADTLVSTGLTFDPHDAALTDLHDQVQRALSAQKSQARQAFLRKLARDAAAAPDPLAAAEQWRQDIDELHAIDSDDPALSELQQHLQLALDHRMAELLEAQNADQALALLARYADLVSPAYVSTSRERLLNAQRTVAQQPVAPARQPTPPAPAAAPVPKSAEPVTADQWRAQIEEGLDKPLTLEQARSLATALEQLALHRDPTAPALKRRLTSRLAKVGAKLNSSEGVDAAVAFTKGVYALFPESVAIKKTLVDLLVITAQRAGVQRDASIASLKGKIDTLLTQPALDNSWDSALKRALRQLAVYLPETDAYVREVKDRAAWLYVAQASKFRGEGRLSAASHMLERSREYAEHSADRDVEDALLADARTRQSIGEKELDRAAYVSSLKEKLIIQAQANDVTAAQVTLRIIGQSLPRDDPFMSQEGPGAIAQAYGRMAWSALKDGQLASAVDLIKRGHEIAPDLQDVYATQLRYIRYQALDAYLAGDGIPDVRKARAEIAALSARDSNMQKVVVPVLVRDFATRIANTGDPDLAARLAHAGRDIFGPIPQFRTR
jgi:serine/threonine protein kinase